MPKRVEVKFFQHKSDLNWWLGADGKDYEILNIEHIRNLGYEVFVVKEISNEEWFEEHDVKHGT